MSKQQEHILLEDDAKEPMTLMVEHRLPWLAIGLAGGIFATILASRFEELLTSNIHLTFFIPVIVYMADAMGHQAETVYIRNLGRKNVTYHVYLIKEFILATILGVLFGCALGLFAYFWFGEAQTAITVGIALSVSISTAPLVALTIPEALRREHTDPAVGAGPFATVLQDITTLLIYFSIATLIIF